MSGCIRTGQGPGSCTGRVALTKKPVHIPDVTADPEYSYPAVELRTLLGLPVLFEDALVGVIGLARESRSGRSSDGEIALMAAFADQSAIAIANREAVRDGRAARRSELVAFPLP